MLQNSFNSSRGSYLLEPFSSLFEKFVCSKIIVCGENLISAITCYYHALTFIMQILSDFSNIITCNF